MMPQKVGAAIILIAVTVLIYVLQQVLGLSFTNSFMLIGLSEGFDILERPWILVTSMFLHSLTNPFHIIFNMLILFFFGPLVESRIGTKRFLGLYFGAGIFAAIIASFFYPAALGASGAIMGMLGVAVMLMPDMRVLLWGIIPMTLRTLAILFVIIDIFNTIAHTNIATMAHFAGLATGLSYGFYLKKRQKKFHKRFSKKTNLDDDDIEEYIRSGRI